jgi:hypothetical protein
MRTNSVAFVVRCCCWLTCFAFSTNKSFAAEFRVSDYDRCRVEFQQSLCTQHWGTIEAIVASATGSTIRFQATDTTERREFSAKRPDPKAELTPIYGYAGLDSPQIWTWEVKKKKTLELEWSGADGPVPVAPGMAATVNVTKDNKIADISYEACITHWRKGKNGFVEIVLGCFALAKPHKMLLVYVRPARMDAGSGWWNIHWTRKWGLLVTVDGAGAESFEVEDSAIRKPAITLANTTEIQIVPGRDGWKALPSPMDYNEARDVKPMTAAQSKAWDEIIKAVPKAQYMKPAG